MKNGDGFYDSEKVMNATGPPVKERSGGCCACWGRRSITAKVVIIAALVLFAGVVVVGGIGLHVYLNVWDGDKDVKISDDAFACDASENCEGAVVDHSLWNEVLAEVIVPGQEENGISYTGVDFERLRIDKALRAKHEAYLEVLATTDTATLGKNELIALMLNAYNAFAVDLIVEKNVKGSIRDLTDLLKGSVFKRFKWRMLIAGEEKDVSLDNVEHQFLREEITQHDVPEVHGGVNCVSVICPDLRGEAFTGKKVKKQLEEQTTLWLRNEGKGLRLDKENNVLYMSALFDWFTVDFVSSKHGGKNDLIDARKPEEWAIQYATDEVREYVEANNPSIKFMGYDWNLIDTVKTEE